MEERKIYKFEKILEENLCEELVEFYEENSSNSVKIDGAKEVKIDPQLDEKLLSIK